MADDRTTAGDVAPIDGTRFRQVLGAYPTGVTLVASVDSQGPTAMVIGSFGSVSLEPPLVEFMPGKSSTTWPRIEASGAYCVNVLAAEQLDLCRSFFARDADPFDDITWRPGPTGSPIIDGSLGWIDCRIDQVLDGGDHWIVVGRVVDLEASSDDAPPLVFHRGVYGTFRPLDGD